MRPGRVLTLRSAVSGAVILSALFNVGADQGAHADRAYRTEAHLTQARNVLTAAWAGQYAYIFGGWIGWYSDEISRFDPQTKTVQVMGAKLPESLRGAGAAWTGQYIYIFAGRTAGGFSDKILRYDPAADSIVTLDTRLPWKDELVKAVWTGTEVYLVGGWGGGSENKITRFVPNTNSVSVITPRLPPANPSAVEAVWTGSTLIAFNALTPPTWANTVSRYDPSTDTVTQMNATLPHGWGISAVWDGHDAYIFGGRDDSEFPGRWYDTIVRYDPDTDTSMIMNARLPTPRSLTAAVWSGEGIYVIGGQGYVEIGPSVDGRCICTGASYESMFFLDFLDEIVRYDPVPFPPTDFRALPGPGVGDVTLSWTPPPRNTYGNPLVGYRIYRTAPPGAETSLVQTHDVTSYVDSTCPIGIPCIYRVAAVNRTGEGQRSSFATFPGWNLTG